ncbi:MAG: DUF4097 family beta strand repeat protein [Candidatus Marinimicrobia bacterium]|nr:DUF4097 family beta strand repeat protein [Candidatus Neomarinimicrobiota bacterium]MBL7010983.1 DUF4097 family beta strand repeat protein [Candidatus Neomarinimicrobiota bacterium]MBL7031117.1 DUF4097 family beta strand repeat protein [Candidatus Neomarinimicrobiota bacterium]
MRQIKTILNIIIVFGFIQAQDNVIVPNYYASLPNPPIPSFPPALVNPVLKQDTLYKTTLVSPLVPPLPNQVLDRAKALELVENEKLKAITKKLSELKGDDSIGDVIEQLLEINLEMEETFGDAPKPDGERSVMEQLIQAKIDMENAEYDLQGKLAGGSWKTRVENSAFKTKISKEIERRFYLPPNGKIDVENKYGDVTVIGWDKDSVLVKAIVTVGRRSEENAIRALDNYDVRMKTWGKSLKITTEIAGADEKRPIAIGDKSIRVGKLVFGIQDEGSYSIDLDIFVSTGVFVKVENKYGEVEIEMIEGDVEVENYNGSISVQNIEGDVLIDNKYGDVEAMEISGTVEISNYNSDILVENIGKSATIKTKYGSIDAVDIGRELDIENYNGDITVRGLKGSLLALNKYGTIKVRNAESTVELENYNGDIELDQINGAITAETKYGSIEIESANPIITCNVYNGDIVMKKIAGGEADMHITSKYGKVKLNLPKDIIARMVLKTKYGSIHYSFMEDAIEKEESTSSLIGLRGSGKGTLRIDGYSTDIYLKD